MQPDAIAHYKITGKLGEGGMGAVYRAIDTKLNREVAIKVLPGTFAADPDRLVRFTREAQVLASLSHPNIATIFGVENNALVMELIEGNDLAGPLPLNEALHIAKQIAEGLEAAHDKGIIHRDLKPANIKVTPEGVVKILDFGLAKATGSATTTSSADSPTLTIGSTQAGLIMGTAGYMSPEQAAGKAVDKRADIWAFGVVLHELLTGRKLFEGETVSHTLASVLKDPIDFAIPQAPPPIQQLLARCLDRNFKHRYKDISEARIAIEDYLANPAPPESSRPATRPTLWMGLAAVFFLAFVAAILLPRSTPSAKPAIHFNIAAAPSSWIAASPDGKWLMKLQTGRAFEVRRVDSPNWLTLTGTISAGSVSAFWSGDSTAVGFVLANRLRVVRLDGSPSRDLTEVQNFRGASWRGGSDDGTILLASHGKLKTFDLRSATIKDIPIDFKQDEPPAEPVFLPEGDGFVFLQDQGQGMRLFRGALHSSSIEPSLLTRRRVQFARHPAAGKWNIFYLAGEQELQTSAIVQTAQVDAKTGNLLSAPVRLVQGISTPPLRFLSRFSVGDSGIFSWTYGRGKSIWNLNWVDLNGNLLAKVAENRICSALALSPDESKIAAEVGDPDSHVWILDSKTGVGGRLTNTPEPEAYPVWARDGKSVFYVVTTPNGQEIRRTFLDKPSRPESIWKSAPVEGNLRFVLSALSADGRYLLGKWGAGGDSLVRLNLQASPPGDWEPLVRSNGFATLSPDGRQLAWGMSDEGLAVQPYPPVSEPPNRHKMKDGLITRNFFSSDGRTLYAHYENNLLAFPVSPDHRIGEPRLVRPWITSSKYGATAGAASRDGKRLLILETDQSETLNPQVISDWTTLLPK